MPQYGGIWTLSQVAQAVKNNTWEGVPPTSIEYLVVAGGGGGGAGIDTGGNGGGGAGGFRQDFTSVSPGVSYSITVGGGGAGSSTNGVAGTNGTNSSFGEFGAGSAAIISLGGGGGGSAASSYAGVPGIGGSGGGGWGLDSSSYPQYSGSAGTNEQGNRGGDGYKNTNGYGAGGGGGGAGSPGGHANAYVAGGNGGMGAASDITGVRTMYAGGGGGGNDARNSVGYQDISSTIIYTPAGGLGGGGNGAYGGTTAPTAGSPNTGGGAGGGAIGYLGSKSGGSGIVVIRYPGNIQYFTGGTVAYNNGYISHTFYSSGTLAPTTPTLFTNPDYQISRSLRFNPADTPYLTRTNSGAGDTRKCTLSFWIKRNALAESASIFSSGSYASSQPNVSLFYNGGSEALQMNVQSSAGTNAIIVATLAKFRDLSSWYHVVLAIDTTQPTATTGVKFYINGVESPIDTGPTYTQYSNIIWNNASAQYIGKFDTNSPYNATPGFYLAETYMIDGQQLGPGSFGYVNPNTGVWTPLQYTGSYGTNGFYLNFADNSNTTAATLGKDLSGNANNFTPNNFSVTAGVGNDSLLDSPTNYGTDTGAGGEVRGNYATFNRLQRSYGTIAYSDGNLVATNSDANWNAIGATMGISTGKWYWEYTSGAQNSFFGFQVPTINYSAINPQDTIAAAGSVLICDDNQYKIDHNSRVSYGSTGHSSGTVVGIAVDMDAGTVIYYKNGTSLGSINWTSSAAYGKTVVPMAIVYDNGTVTRVNFGQRPFAYTAPSGYKALCTQNLPTPTIGSTSATLATKFMGVDTWSATDSNYRPIYTGVDMATYGGLIWIKSRNVTVDHYIADTGRGLTKYLAPNKTVAEDTYDAGLVSKPYGFDLNSGSASFNQPGQGYTWVGWNWAAGGAAVTNTTGSISAQVSANPLSGFSIVTYTGTGVNATIGHGIGTAPAMVIVKQRNTTRDWIVYHSSLGGATKFLTLDTTDASQTAATFWNSTAPNSTVFSIGTDGALNTSGGTFVAYCWAEVPGFSRFGSYTGNGSADGPFVYCGFRPRFVMWKCTSNSSTSWEIIDTARSTNNVVKPYLLAESSSGEETSYEIVDILSNGFKIKYAGGASINAGGYTYIFAAFAESPFKYSRAR